MKTRTTGKSGFTLVEIMIVVAIIGLLAAIAIPNFVKARATSQANACINNLRQIYSATQQWALENQEGAGAPVAFSNISIYLHDQVICPSGGTNFASSYSLNCVSNQPVCIIGSGWTPAHVLPVDTSG